MYNITTATFTPIDDFLGPAGTWPQGIDGDNIVGYYDDGNEVHGFLYSITKDNYTQIEFPTGNNTQVWGISGSNIVGTYTSSADNSGPYLFIAKIELSDAKPTPTPISGQPTPKPTPKYQTITFASIPAKQLSSPPFAVSANASSGLPVVISVVSGPATISGRTVTVTGDGTVVLAANQTGNATYAAAPQVTRSFQVSQSRSGGTQAQIITFPVVPTQTYGTAPITVSPKASSGLPVTVTVESGPATITNSIVTISPPVGRRDAWEEDPAIVTNNIITITGAGSVVLAANQLGNSIYKAAPQVSMTFTVNKASQTISAFPTIPSQSYPAPLQLLGSAPLVTASSGLPIILTVLSGPAYLNAGSDNLKSASAPLSEVSSILFTGMGTVVLAADQSGNANYLPATEVTTSFTVANTPSF